MSQISKVAVVAVDHPGNWHADKNANAAACELMTLVGAHSDNTSGLAQKRDTDVYTVFRAAILPEDAISQTLSIGRQYKIVRTFLKAAIDQMRNILIPKESLKTEIIDFMRANLSAIIEPERNQVASTERLIIRCGG